MPQGREARFSTGGAAADRRSTGKKCGDKDFVQGTACGGIHYAAAPPTPVLPEMKPLLLVAVLMPLVMSVFSPDSASATKGVRANPKPKAAPAPGKVSAKAPDAKAVKIAGD